MNAENPSDGACEQLLYRVWSNGRRAANDVMAFKRYDDVMAGKRSTIYFDPDLHRAVRIKAAATDRTVSDVVNDAVRRTLAEDAEDLEAFERRRREPSLNFEDVVRSMKRRGKL
jgi:hypothetical protein